jgi:hypothetical protein
MRNIPRHPLAERHSLWMVLLYTAFILLLTLVSAKAVGGMTWPL